jgi:hypothetical protein
MHAATIKKNVKSMLNGTVLHVSKDFAGSLGEKDWEACG